MKNCWILCDKGKMGTYRQCLALAQALEESIPLTVEHKQIDLRWPWRFLPPHFALGKRTAGDMQPDLSQPYPDLIIAGGRQAVTAAVALRKKSYTIVFQNPRIEPGYFDLVIAPYHDNLRGENVIQTLGAIHPIKQETLVARRAELKLDPSKTHVAVLLGGDSKHYTYTKECVLRLAENLMKMAHGGGSLLITPSRRTRPDILDLLAGAIQSVPHQIWHGDGVNPYIDYLSAADAVVVTGDSISMMSEACITGKPVYIHELPIKNKRFLDFMDMLYRHNHAKPLAEFNSRLGDFQQLDELGRIIPDVLSRLDFCIK
ncbi:MAG: mitochondrial fission ELM1 family protein [Alphaproteobacteria bacterium]|nr:mitochondrial fission ELM1 family protein [Alphaproteobacteria bacterium]